jgi:hypothetical protein
MDLGRDAISEAANGPLFLQIRQASTKDRTNNIRLRPKLDETGRQISDVDGICKGRKKMLMIKDVRPQRLGSADEFVVNPTRQQKMKQTDTRTFQDVDAFKTICRPPYRVLEKRPRVVRRSGDHNERQGRVSSDLHSHWARRQARDAILDLVH